MKLHIGKAETEIQLDRDVYVHAKAERYTFALSSHGYVRLIRYIGKSPLGKYEYETTYLHRYALGATEGEYVDHINGNRLDNRKVNLRKCTNAQNLRNQGPRNGRYKGVHWSKKLEQWVVQITVDYKCIHIGCFKKEDDAARAYNKASRLHHGEYGYLNRV